MTTADQEIVLILFGHWPQMSEPCTDATQVLSVEISTTAEQETNNAKTPPRVNEEMPQLCRNELLG